MKINNAKLIIKRELMKSENVELTLDTFPNSRFILLTCHNMGITESKDIVHHLKELYKTDRYEFYCLLLTIINPKYQNKKLSKQDLFNLILVTFYKNGIHLYSNTEMDELRELLEECFPGQFSSYSRKRQGEFIRVSKEMIAYNKGIYILRKEWNTVELQLLQSIYDSLIDLLESHDSVSIDELYLNHKNELDMIHIDSAYYLFSLLKELYKEEKIEFYRNTFSIEYRKKGKRI